MKINELVVYGSASNTYILGAEMLVMGGIQRMMPLR